MHTNYFRLFLAGIFFLALFNWRCSKIDTTGLGADLIPAVDNVHTFADTLQVNAVQGLFSDTSRMTLSENHVLGSINNDPLFGKTKADVFVEMKPSFFPFYFGNNKDTINPLLAPGTGFDSVVLCLAYKGYYGDTSIPQKFSVYQLDNNTTNFKDSSYLLNFQPNVTPTNLLGQAIVKASDLSKYVKFINGKDSVTNQIRIKITNTAFINALVGRDSTSTGSNNAFYKDSVFKTFYKGFAIVAENSYGGNGLFYVGLTDANSRLEVHFRRKNNNKIDTTFTNLPVSTGSNGAISVSASANYLQRNRSGSEMVSPLSNALYIQSTPGSFVTLTIPALDTFKNNIIHRAELVMEKIPDLSNPTIDQVLGGPAYLYLDLVDTGSTVRYKTIYYDLNPSSSYDPDNSISFFPSGGIDFTYFGGVIRKKTDPLTGVYNTYYNFNLTRYVQNMVTKRGINYKLRVFAPFNLAYNGYNFPFNNSLAYGRIRVGSGNNPNYRLRMRIVYSKI